MIRKVAIFLAAIFLINMLFAQQQQGGGGINWRNGIDLFNVTMWIQKYTGKKFLFADESLKQRKIYFVSDKDIPSKEDKFAVFQSILQISGFVISKVGEGDTEIYKIIPIEKGPNNPSEYRTGKEKIRLEDVYVTRLFTLKYISPRDVQTVLMNLVTQPRGLLPIESAGMVLVTDYDYNISRFAKIIEAMDIKRPDVEIEMVQLKNALATDVEGILNSLVQTIIQGNATKPRPGAPPGTQEQVKIVADKRTNSIVILAEPQRIDQIKDLVARLDRDIGFATSGIYVYHLKYSNADELTKTLTSIYTGAAQSGTVPGAPPIPGAPGAVGATAGAAGKIGVPTFVADVPSNSIMIVSDHNTYKKIEELIGRLDQRKPQVLIRASIIEITSDDTVSLGAELSSLDQPTSHITGFGSTNFGLSTLVNTNGGTIPNARVPVVTPGIILGAWKGQVGNIGALLQANNAKSKVHVLSEPEAVTRDNQIAKLTVKNQVPVVTTNFTGTGVGSTSFGGFQDAGTTLTITPHISEARSLRLDIDFLIEKFAVAAANPNIPPPKTTREIVTSITIPNGRTIVMGGMVVNDVETSSNGIPILSSIPLLGLLAGAKTDVHNKTTLYLFVTPYILNEENYGDAESLTIERKDEVNKISGGVNDLKIKMGAPNEPQPQPSSQPKMMPNPPK